MRARTHRRLDLALITGGAVVVGVVALVGGLIGDNERIRGMWVSAEVQEDGAADVVEVIDYDFGALAQNKHGIFRIVPGLSTSSQIAVSSEDVPDDVSVQSETTDEGPGVRIRIGDPGVTVSGEHRYRIGYRLPGVVTDSRLDWDAVGTGWEVGIEQAEVHVVAPFEFADPACFAGSGGSTGGCDVEQVEPGHLVATVSGLGDHEGLSIESDLGERLAAAPAAPAPPTHAPDNPSSGLLPPAGIAAAAALVAAVPAAALIRRTGRERVGTGGAADAAYAGPNPAGEMRIDQDDLEAMATTDFAPPEGLSPAQGGIVLTETVQPQHKTAWLIQAAIDGAIDLDEEGGKTVRLSRTGPGTPEEARILDQAFNGRDVVELGTYDRRFAESWAMLDSDLEVWRGNSGLWDPSAHRRRYAALVVGILGTLAGLALAGVGGALANRWGGAWLAVALVGGLVAGAGLTAALTSWELRVRTAVGSAAWLRVESFRRFLAGSEAFHAEEAARRGVLREYTAWALAVGEIDRWSRAVSASTAIPADAGLGYVYLAPLLVASTTSTSTAPSSSGGGGGGIGSVGGGAGGGGGGSW
jgi:Predicted membrane protein (DUF2207)